MSEAFHHLEQSLDSRGSECAQAVKNLQIMSSQSPEILGELGITEGDLHLLLTRAEEETMATSGQNQASASEAIQHASAERATVFDLNEHKKKGQNVPSDTGAFHDQGSVIELHPSDGQTVTQAFRSARTLELLRLDLTHRIRENDKYKSAKKKITLAQIIKNRTGPTPS